MGWDELRKASFERQRALGVIPAEAELTARHESRLLECVVEAASRIVRRRIEGGDAEAFLASISEADLAITR